MTDSESRAETLHRLEQLLESGAITRGDYDRLHRAMERASHSTSGPNSPGTEFALRAGATAAGAFAGIKVAEWLGVFDDTDEPDGMLYAALIETTFNQNIFITENATSAGMHDVQYDADVDEVPSEDDDLEAFEL